MKRCWFGFGLLLAMLIGGALVTRVMTQSHEALSSRLEQAAAAAAAENWDGAEEHFLGARKAWEENWLFSAAFADHEPMEEIDGLFAQGEVYLHARNPEGLAAICAQLSKDTNAIGEAHALNWWNLL